jgi:hypothetical protein
MAASLRSLPADRLPADLQARLERIVASYYREPASGLAEELRFGNLVYLLDDEAGNPGAFLVVNLDHHRAVIAERAHRFTYLGLGCAKGCPMPPVFGQVRDDLRDRLEPGEVGVLHLTTRTPHAIRGLERAFPGGIAPRPESDSPDDLRIAAHVKSTIHRHPEREPGESPFVLRQLKKGRFTPEEVARIRASTQPTALSRFRVDCEGEDELIVFHRFEREGTMPAGDR